MMVFDAFRVYFYRTGGGKTYRNFIKNEAEINNEYIFPLSHTSFIFFFQKKRKKRNTEENRIHNLVHVMNNRLHNYLEEINNSQNCYAVQRMAPEKGLAIMGTEISN